MRRFLEKITRRRVDNQNSQSDSQQTRNSADTGLKMVYEGTSCSVDIVAIHGDGGHYKESWTHPNSHVFWLQDLLPSIVPDSRILSFGYSVSKTDFVPAEKICEALLGELSEMRQDLTTTRQRPIIFLAHSFGVLVLKAALAMSSSSKFDSIISSTRGIMFFGSPSDISHSLQSLVLSFSSTTDTAPEPAGLTAMKKDLTWLQDAESRYNALVLEEKDQFEVIYFLEIAGERYESSEAQREGCIRMRKSHGMMIKFSAADDEDFYLVKERIRQIMENHIMN